MTSTITFRANNLPNLSTQTIHTVYAGHVAEQIFGGQIDFAKFDVDHTTLKVWIAAFDESTVVGVTAFNKDLDGYITWVKEGYDLNAELAQARTNHINKDAANKADAVARQASVDDVLATQFKKFGVRAGFKASDLGKVVNVYGLGDCVIVGSKKTTVNMIIMQVSTGSKYNIPSVDLLKLV